MRVFEIAARKLLFFGEMIFSSLAILMLTFIESPGLEIFPSIPF